MRKMKSKYLSGLLIALLLVANFTTVVFAVPVDPPVDFDERGSITVHKFSYDGDDAVDGTGLDGQVVPVSATPLPGTVYEIEQTHELVQRTDNSEELVATTADPVQGTTDGSGEWTFDNLDLGRYTLKEVSAPGHLVDSEIYYIDVPLTVTDGTQLLYGVHVYPKNIPVVGGVQFQKLGEDVQAEALAGVTFYLFHKDGSRVDSVDYVSDASGLVQVSGLSTGEYYFEEVATVNGYLLNNTQIPFEIEEIIGDQQNDTVVLSDFQNYKEPEVFKEQRDLNETDWSAATNTLIGETVDFRLTATAPTDIADFIKFGLSDSIDSRLDYTNGSTVVYINDTDETLVEGDDYTLTEGPALKVSLTAVGIAKLAAGDELFVEFSAVVNESAFEQGDIPNTAVVDWDNNKGDEREKDSVPTITTPLDGKITITKVAKDDNGKLLAGATFKLQEKNASGDWVDVAGSTQTTGSTGVLTWDRLVSGEYRLVETKAPEGYNLLANPIEFVIDDGTTNLAHELLVENMPEGSIPQTGGMGTLFFTIFGISLMAVSGFGLVRSRKQRA